MHQGQALQQSSMSQFVRQVSVAIDNSMGSAPDDNTFAASCGSSAQSLQEICEQSMLLIFHSQVLMNDTQPCLPEAHTDVTSISYTQRRCYDSSKPHSETIMCYEMWSKDAHKEVNWKALYAVRKVNISCQLTSYTVNFVSYLHLLSLRIPKEHNQMRQK